MAFEATSLLDLRHRFLVGSGRPSVLMLIRSPRYRETSLALELLMMMMFITIFAGD